MKAARPPLLRARLLDALQQAAETDRIIKGIDTGDAWRSLERTVMRVAGAPLPALDGIRP